MKLAVKEKTNVKENALFLPALKGTFFALCISLFSILLFAIIIKFTGITDGVIKPINQVIKVISIFVGTLIAYKKNKNLGITKGLIVGILYTTLAFLIFSILDGNFTFSTTLLNDILFGSIIGILSGIICKLIVRQ